jgi:hypothetical protein
VSRASLEMDAVRRPANPASIRPPRRSCRSPQRAGDRGPGTRARSRSLACRFTVIQVRDAVTSPGCMIS